MTLDMRNHLQYAPNTYAVWAFLYIQRLCLLLLVSHWCREKYAPPIGQKYDRWENTAFENGD